MLKVTFYSYKGGVGRTLAMLNTAALLAERGRRVLVVDFDLEAPGLGLSALTSTAPGSSASKRLGVSDFLLNRAADSSTPVSSYVYPAMTNRFEERFQVMTVGTRAGELSNGLEELFREPQGDLAHLFMLLVAEIQAFIDPDYVFFDSRTGLADIAGVCTMDLPDLLVAVSGLNEQNIGGMEGALEQMREYWGMAARNVATLLVLSPVPREIDLQPRGNAIHTMNEVFREYRDRPGELGDALGRHPLGARIYQAQARLFAPLKQELPRKQPHFPDLQEADLLHFLEYDPWLALGDALVGESNPTLTGQYRRLAQSIGRAAADTSLEFSGAVDPPPIFA